MWYFLLFLHQKKGLSLSCILGYRSMLSTVFRYRLPEIATSPVIRDLLRSFFVGRPRRLVSPPDWNLDVVLKYLMIAQFEPIQRPSKEDPLFAGPGHSEESGRTSSSWQKRFICYKHMVSLNFAVRSVYLHAQVIFTYRIFLELTFSTEKSYKNFQIPLPKRFSIFR